MCVRVWISRSRIQMLSVCCVFWYSMEIWAGLARAVAHIVAAAVGQFIAHVNFSQYENESSKPSKWWHERVQAQIPLRNFLILHVIIKFELKISVSSRKEGKWWKVKLDRIFTRVNVQMLIRLPCWTNEETGNRCWLCNYMEKVSFTYLARYSNELSTIQQTGELFTWRRTTLDWLRLCSWRRIYKCICITKSNWRGLIAKK